MVLRFGIVKMVFLIITIDSQIPSILLDAQAVRIQM